MARDDSNGFLWFLTGLGIGAAIGVLYAPKSGRETRDLILQKAEESKAYAREGAEKARSQANQWVSKGKDVVSQQKEQFRSAYEAGRQAYREATGEGSEGTEGGV